MDDWRQRVDAVWAAADRLGEQGTVEAVDALVAERPPGDPVALFEAAGARDFAGREAEAELAKAQRGNLATELAGFKVALAQAKADLLQSERLVSRQRELAREGLVAPRQLEDAEAAADRLEAALERIASLASRPSGEQTVQLAELRERLDRMIERLRLALDSKS